MLVTAAQGWEDGMTQCPQFPEPRVSWGSTTGEAPAVLSHGALGPVAMGGQMFPCAQMLFLLAVASPEGLLLCIPWTLLEPKRAACSCSRRESRASLTPSKLSTALPLLPEIKTTYKQSFVAVVTEISAGATAHLLGAAGGTADVTFLQGCLPPGGCVVFHQ